MGARWGVSERHGWKGMKNHDPGLNPPECPYCHDDGYREDKGTYCHCRLGRELLASDLEVASRAALTPHDERNAA